MEVCREIRKFSAIPILMLTARVRETDRVLGLEMGADDYICKPFSPREVVARVKAVLRRGQPIPKWKILKEGEIELHEETRQVMICGQEIQLTPIEFGLLKVMMAQPKRIFPRNELINNVQGYGFEGYDRTVDTHIKNLRKKIAAILPDQEVIHSVYGVGYKLQVTENCA
jgi:two-component system response regulator BaeR